MSHNESRTHKAFKRVAIDLLKERGFLPHQIHEEYEELHRFDGRVGRYVIDVVGIGESRKVAVECGGNKLSKLVNLRKLFDEVIVVDNDTVVGMYEYWRTRFYEEVWPSKREAQRYKKEAERICEEANKEVDALRKEVEALKEENGRLKSSAIK